MGLGVDFTLEDLGGTGNSQLRHLLAQLLTGTRHFARNILVRLGNNALAFGLSGGLGLLHQ